MRTDIDHFFSNIFGDSFQTVFGRNSIVTPTSIEIDVPGCTREDVDIHLTPQGSLAIKWKYRGQPIEQYYRISREVNQEAITATVKDGILTVSLPSKPKNPDPPTRKILVS